MASANPPPDDPPLGNYGYDEKAVARGLSKRRQSEWLERSKKWPDLPARRWAARKVIGKGAYGICGQWDYTGNDKSMPRQIVVKQSIGSTAKILRGESKMMHLTTSTGADYVVKLYKGCHRGAGTGTSDIDPLPYNSLGMYIPHQEVVRMYMEYAPGGDLDAFFKRLIATPGARVIPEEHLWRLLHCLAKASMALEFGTEDPAAPPANVAVRVMTAAIPAVGQPGEEGYTPTVPATETIGSAPWKPICHFDIKHENILIGNRDQGEHQRLEIFKIADFGLSRFAPLTREQRRNPLWIKGTQWRATAVWTSPEQFYEIHYNRDIGVTTNIWAVGAVINKLIIREDLDLTASFMHTNSATGLPIRVSGSPKVLLNRNKCPYSAYFINTLCRCLAWNPAERITSKELYQTTLYILGYFDLMNRPLPPLDSLYTNNEPSFHILPPGPDATLALQNFAIPKLIREREIREAFTIVDNGTTEISPNNLAFRLKMKRGKPVVRVEQSEYPFTALSASPVNPPTNS